MKRRTLIVGILLGIGVLGLNGCKQAEESVIIPENSVIETGESVSEEAVVPEDLALGEDEREPEELPHESRNPSTVLEDENAVYFCGKQHILKWDKISQQTDIIWMTDKMPIAEDAYAYRDRKGILIGNKIYFMEYWLTDPENPVASMTEYALAVVNTDGSGYREIEHVEGTNRLLLLDGILYFDYDVNSKALKGYVVDADGNLLMDAGKVLTEPVNVPKDYVEITYQDNGLKFMSAIESAYRYGYYLLRDENYKLCIVNQDTGEKKTLPDEMMDYSLVSCNQKYFLMEEYSYPVVNFYLVDIQTMEKKSLITTSRDINVIGMDEEWVYWQRNDENMDMFYYERIPLDGGATEGLFENNDFLGMVEESPWYLMDISVVDDYIYYVGEKNYKFYLMRRNLDFPQEEEIIGDAFYDSGIGKVGTITAYKENIFSDYDSDVVLGSIDLEWLIVNDNFPGADKINTILEAEQQENMEYERTIAKGMEEYAADGLSSSISSRVSPIYHFNERYISFTQQNYDYTGGAHGMPYWVPYTFDLETGDELGLSDIVANSEEEFKDIVTAQFTEMYEVDPGMYWDDAVQCVHDWTDFESAFYLGSDGLVIYYGPYDLASYAAGFQEIVVPYDKLELYIPLGE